MTATRNLLSLAIGLALASPSVFAYDCPADQITTIPNSEPSSKMAQFPKSQQRHQLAQGLPARQPR